jgi:LPS sulfotransferase NodH
LSVAPPRAESRRDRAQSDEVSRLRIERVNRQLREISDVRFASNPFRSLERRFAIAHSPRVGSHFLCEGLLAHGAVVEEFFEIPRIKTVSAKHGFSTLEAYCGWMLDRFAVRGVFGVSGGVKLLAPLELAGEIPEFLSDWRFVHLRRLNVVKQGVSELVARLTGSFRSIKEPNRALVDADYDGSRIMGFINDGIEVNRAWKEVFVRYSVTPLQLTYEELVADTPAVLARTAEFLDLRGPPITEERFLAPHLKQQATSLNANWEARFREENAAFCASHDTSAN